jgi:hypothetical protein
MQWNNIDYDMQMKILDRIGDLILQETDESMQFGIAAAITELEVWSNSPIREVGHTLEEPPVEQKPILPDFVEAQDPVFCCSCWFPWFCKCSCHKKDS